MANLTVAQKALFESVSSYLETALTSGETETTTAVAKLLGYSELPAAKKEEVKIAFRAVVYALFKAIVNDANFNALKGTKGLTTNISNGTSTLHFVNGILTEVTTP